jgi:hypothetical protein
MAGHRMGSVPGMYVLMNAVTAFVVVISACILLSPSCSPPAPPTHTHTHAHSPPQVRACERGGGRVCWRWWRWWRRCWRCFCWCRRARLTRARARSARAAPRTQLRRRCLAPGAARVSDWQGDPHETYTARTHAHTHTHTHAHAHTRTGGPHHDSREHHTRSYTHTQGIHTLRLRKHKSNTPSEAPNRL